MKENLCPAKDDETPLQADKAAKKWKKTINVKSKTVVKNKNADDVLPEEKLEQETTYHEEKEKQGSAKSKKSAAQEKFRRGSKQSLTTSHASNINKEQY